MDKQEKYSDDPLKSYFDPEEIEKVPGGFTSRVMLAIADEKKQVRVTGNYRKKTLVPYISCALIIMLTIAAFFIPDGESNIFAINVPGFLNHFNTALPEIDLGTILRIDVPSEIIYTLIGISFLSLLDRALYLVFHREK